jgi:anthranilate phosphoribosyltransferase
VTVPHAALRDALKAVSRGEELSREAARRAFEAVLEDSAPAVLVAGLLSALASRGESADVLAGVVDVLTSMALRPPVDADLAARAVDVCGTGGDGLGTFNVSTAAAFVVAGAGVPVAKHGNRAVSSACGSADVLAELGVDVEMSPERAARALRAAGVTFLFAPLYHAAMKRVAPVRKELGIRTVFNLAGPLSNPAGVSRQIVGVDRPERVELLARVLLARGARRAFVFSNTRGGDELLPLGTTRIAEIADGRMRTFEVCARDFGLEEGEPEHLGGGAPARNADILRRVLAGEAGTAKETVLMNAAAALVVADAAADFRDGVARARRSIEEGAALRTLESLVAISRGRE